MMFNSLEPPAIIALVLIILFVFVINFLLLQALRGKKTFREVEMLRKMGKRLKQPWEEEDKQLEELNKLVTGLKVDKSSHNVDK